MQPRPISKLHSFLAPILVGFCLITFIGALSLATPSEVSAQDEKKDGEKKDDDVVPATKGPINPFVHFFASIGICFGLIFAAISVGMVALIIILVMDLRMGEAMPWAFVEEFTEMVNKRQFKQAYDLCRNDNTFIARVLTAGLSRLQYGIEDAREAMGAMVDSVKASKDSWVSYLGIIGTLGPLLGLVGTVSGMIGAFRKLGETEGAPKATELAGEISHALVVTLVGVAIACPAIFFFTFFKNRLTSIAVNVHNKADDLLTQMYHNSKKAGGGSEAATAVQAKR